jgi:hypothetical protein
VTRCRIIGSVLLAFALCGTSAIGQTSGSAPTSGQQKDPGAASKANQQPGNPAPAANNEVQVQAWVDRTAIWVADRVTYTIELTCQPGVDILAADLTPDKLGLDGLEAVGNDIEHDVGPGDVTIYRFRYYLTTYRVDAPTLKIGAMVVRYYVKRAGQQLGDAPPLGEVQIPPVTIAFRSLLPDDQQKLTVRDYQAAAARPRLYARLQSIGMALIVISVLPAMLFLAAIGRRLWVRAHPAPVEGRREDSRTLASVQGMDVATVEGRREAYTRVNALVRDHVGRVCGFNAPNLTPGEISAALSSNGTQVSGELVSSVLTACELALYAPVEAMPSAEACRATMEQAGRVLASGR